MKELRQFKRVIKKRIKAHKRKVDLKAKVRYFKQQDKALKLINKDRQQHINKLKQLKG
jgi:predicted site-specific integrase-resolvase